MTNEMERLRSDLTEAIRNRDELRTATLRMALAALQQESVSGRQARELSEEDVRKVLARERKRREEAAASFADAGRQDRAERERAEAEVLSAYLPTPLSEAETAALVAEVIEATGATGPRDTGKVIKEVMARAEGRAEGREVSQLVRASLTG